MRAELSDITKDLRPEFRKAMLAAALLSPQKEPPMRRLHQSIIGPPASGKTTEAYAYAAALAAAKLVADIPPVMLSGADLIDIQRMRDGFAKSEGGVLIIDDIDKACGHELADRLLVNFDETKRVVIFTGNKEGMEGFLQTARPELAARMPRAVETPKTFTPEERRAYRQAKEDARQAKLMEERRRQSVIEWMALAGDVTAKQQVAPMGALKFTPPSKRK